MPKHAEPAKTTRVNNTSKTSDKTNKLSWLKKKHQTRKKNGLKAGQLGIVYTMSNQQVEWGEKGAKT